MVRLPGDLFTVPSTFKGPEIKLFLEPFMDMVSHNDHMWGLVESMLRDRSFEDITEAKQIHAFLG